MVEVAASLSIGQVSERTGLSVHALRFYEQEGLFIDAVRRGLAGAVSTARTTWTG